MNTPNRAILIGGVVAAAVIAGVVTLLLYEKQDYRDCVAQMWDRKHQAEVRQRQSDANFRECEAYRLREGANCDCKARDGQPGYCVTPGRVMADTAPDRIPNQANPCDISRSKSYAARRPPQAVTSLRNNETQGVTSRRECQVGRKEALATRRGDGGKSSK